MNSARIQFVFSCYYGKVFGAESETTIIVKSVGKVAFFTSSFPSSPHPWPNVDQNVNALMFVRVIVLLYPNIELGGTGDI